MRAIAALLMLLSSVPTWAEPAPRFRPIDVIVDPRGQPLAAYQIEIVMRGNAQIVGVEGGEHPAFAPAPYYDPAALNQGRIVIAAFSTDPNVPGSVSRVATIHVREAGAALARYDVKLVTTADRSGAPINAIVSLRPRLGDLE